MTTITQLVDFVIKYRRGKAWLDWSPIEIADAIIEAVQDNALVYCVNSGGTVTGLITGVKFSGDKVMYVSNVLTIDKAVLRTFVPWFRSMYPGWTLEARRRDKEVKYMKTDRLLRLVSKGGY